MTKQQQAIIDYLKKYRPGETVTIRENEYDSGSPIIFQGTVEELEKYYQNSSK